MMGNRDNAGMVVAVGWIPRSKCRDERARRSAIGHRRRHLIGDNDGHVELMCNSFQLIGETRE